MPPDTFSWHINLPQNRQCCAAITAKRVTSRTERAVGVRHGLGALRQGGWHAGAGRLARLQAGYVLWRRCGFMRER
jgi:hypothetical protein